MSEYFQSSSNLLLDTAFTFRECTHLLVSIVPLFSMSLSRVTEINKNAAWSLCIMVHELEPDI